MKYKQLNLEKRYQISALIKAGLNQKSIANELGVHPSTISREFKQNSDIVRGNNAEFAQINSSKVEMKKKKCFSLTKPIEKYIRVKLKKDWSPEQISGRMKLDTGVSVVHETIYRYRPTLIKAMVVSYNTSDTKTRDITIEVMTIKQEGLL